MDQSKKLLFIVNPVAGRAQARKALPEVLRIFQTHGYLPTVLITGKRGDATDYARRYAANYDLVVCSGGDGTFSEVLTGLQAHSFAPQAGYLPAGSSNVFAATHGLSTDILTAAQQLMQAPVAQLDIGMLNERPFAFTASFGAFSWMSYSTSQNAKNYLGSTAYILDGIRDLPLLKAETLRITTPEGQVCQGDFIFGCINNAASIGGVLPMAKDSISYTDGKFEVLLVRMPVAVTDLQNVLPALLKNDYSHPLLDYFQASSLTVESETGLAWSADGEEYRAGAKTAIHVLPKTLNIRL